MNRKCYNDLFGLWLDMREVGLNRLCGRFEISEDYKKIFFTYRDNLLTEQFAFLERSSGTGYRISIKNKPVYFRTKKSAFNYLHDFLHKVIEDNEKYTVLTVDEFSKLTKHLSVRGYKVIKDRLDDKKRYDKYLDKKFPKE